MRGLSRITVVVAVVAAALGGSAPTGASRQPPLWVRHVVNFPGGISVGPRSRLAALEARASAGGPGTASPLAGADVQMNADCDPPRPQNETSVAYNPNDPSNAVAAANDYCGDGFWIGFTFDGGSTWGSVFKDPKLSTGARCFGSDPSVVYSLRDAAFYLATLCFSPFDPSSEVQVWKSTDGGRTWTDSFAPAVAISNIRADGSIDASVFYDKELLAVDNDPASARFGRLYLTFIKFHMVGASGRSDYCPVQLASTDASPADPADWTWSHTAVVPDAPGAKGLGPSANQWAIPVVDDVGGLDVAYVIEDCNTGVDRGLFFTRSTDGGATFSSPVRIDEPGRFADNPNRQDLLPAKHARLPISPSLAFDPTRDRLLFAYQNNVNRGTSGADISLQVSDDFGATWSDPSVIAVTPSGAPAPNDQFFPWLAVDPTGTVHAIWYDNRNDPGNKLIETFVGVSKDGGATWTNVDVSDVAWNPDASFFSCGCFIGDYNGLAASGSVTYPVWTDGRTTPGQPSGQTDIFTDPQVSS
ncbi:MAG TPA: sialidase family protein [Actinomycetota bacterium]|nr:sialidase family protein [Actinomycetota bacterium]